MKAGPTITFRDNATGVTEGYGVHSNGQIQFTHVAYVNGLKYNLISICQLCDVDFKILFDKVQDTIYNINGDVVLIAPRRKDVYIKIW